MIDFDEAWDIAQRILASTATYGRCICLKHGCSSSCGTCSHAGITYWQDCLRGKGIGIALNGLEMTLLRSGETWSLGQLVTRYGQCVGCTTNECHADCPPCQVLEHKAIACLSTRRVRLRPYEMSIQVGYRNGDLPCPYDSDHCTVADGRWYHGDCVPPTLKLPLSIPPEDFAQFEKRFADSLKGRGHTIRPIVPAGGPLANAIIHALAQSGVTVRQFEREAMCGGGPGSTLNCGVHGAHPHGYVGTSCPRCPACKTPDGLVEAMEAANHVAVVPPDGPPARPSHKSSLNAEERHEATARYRERKAIVDGWDAAFEECLAARGLEHADCLAAAIAAFADVVSDVQVLLFRDKGVD